MAVGMLHQDGNDGRTTPLPDARALPVLVEQFRTAGADAAFTVEGASPAARHHRARALPDCAGGSDQLGEARARRTNAVRLEVEADEAQLTVDTAGGPGPAAVSAC